MANTVSCGSLHYHGRQKSFQNEKIFLGSLAMILDNLGFLSTTLKTLECFLKTIAKILARNQENARNLPRKPRSQALGTLIWVELWRYLALRYERYRFIRKPLHLLSLLLLKTFISPVTFA